MWKEVGRRNKRMDKKIGRNRKIKKKWRKNKIMFHISFSGRFDHQIHCQTSFWRSLFFSTISGMGVSYSFLSTFRFVFIFYFLLFYFLFSLFLFLLFFIFYFLFFIFYFLLLFFIWIGVRHPGSNSSNLDELGVFSKIGKTIWVKTNKLKKKNKK